MSHQISIKTLTTKDFRKMPWKNGGGSTEELLVHPNTGPFAFRFSVASIESSGPFSLFPGFQRVLIPLEGEIVLQHAGEAARKLRYLEPYHFDGNLQTHCQLESDRARDFNVIYKPEEIEVEVRVFDSGEGLVLDLVNAARIFVYSVKGEIKIAGVTKEDAGMRLGEHCLCELPGDLGNIRLGGEGVGVLVAISTVAI